MLGEQDAVVTAAETADIHGVTYHDVSVTLADGTTASARLGPEAVPEGLSPGDRVVVTMAVNMPIAIRRAE